MAHISNVGRASLISNIFTNASNNKSSRRTSLQIDLPSNKQSPHRSFYRQPNMQRVRPAPSLEFRRQQYGRYLWVSDSCFLPAAKQGLARRHSSAEVMQHHACYECQDEQEDAAPRPPSILKRGLSEDNPSSEHKRSTTHFRKQLSFQESVDVVYFDRLESVTSNERKEQEKLKDNALAQQRVTERTVHMKCTLHTDDNRSCDKDEKCECPANPNPIFKNKKGEIVKDLTGKYSWKLFIPIGTEFIRNRTSVKALSGGHKLIVLTYKDKRGEDGQTYSHQFIEKIHLPHPIDAYGVRASMDKDGNLKISAPFLSDKFKS